jgi:hypothetical protein
MIAAVLHLKDDWRCPIVVVAKVLYSDPLSFKF